MHSALKVTLFSVLSLATFAQAQSFDNNFQSAVSHTKAAHKSYLKRDWATLSREVHAVLSQENLPQYLKDNVVKLTRAATLQAGGNLPTDWTLPTEVSQLKTTITRTDTGETTGYRFAVAVNVPAADSLTSLKVTRFPDTVMVDLENKVGEFESAKDEDSSTYKISLKRNTGETPAAEGLYLIHLELNNGKKVDGWYVISDLVTKEPVQMMLPAAGETLKSATPTFNWKDYHSSSYQPNEGRAVYFTIARSEPPSFEWDPVFETYEYDAQMTKLTVGQGVASKVSKLEDGRYIVLVSYNERTKFGPMKLRREATLIRHFYVNTKGN